MAQKIFSDVIPGASHWSLVVPAGHSLTFIDVNGGANVSLLFYNPVNPLERYNAPDTLKCQHTFKLTTGHCLYSDMGRIFCSVVADDTGWIDTVGGLANEQKVTQKWGQRDYQKDRNQWHQNGYDSMLVEVAKYGLGKRDLAANLNLFSKVQADGQGNLSFVEHHSKAGDQITLRFEIDTLVVLSTCPHPMNSAEEYPFNSIEMSLSKSAPVLADDACKTSRPENERGFENNHRYCSHA
ncbi:urea amidolyase associated protein UAAP1 [Echinimonas agarilytica]|uniref:Urea carboxylase-associated family protein n=1 Tax=Echinimonas agarilytica TaxID=1215918 RepID=A0AA41W4N4_9GAMM|nr:urea amidolyase associated protein UAAP1 [Echinimonas agarilytica]MCM2678678.1 urea carboxylase-associated family protein [Echinimonas agarilytica]